jgi:hypothetical protein
MVILMRRRAASTKKKLSGAIFKDRDAFGEPSSETLIHNVAHSAILTQARGLITVTNKTSFAPKPEFPYLYSVRLRLQTFDSQIQCPKPRITCMLKSTASGTKL